MKYWIVLLVVAAPVVAVAQNNLFDLRGEVNEQAKVTYTNIIYARTWGKFLGEVFHVRQPQTNYYETTIGLGYNLVTFSDVALYGLIHHSWATDGTYVQPGILAIDVSGKWIGSLWVVHYYPLTDAGVRQWLVDPIEVQITLRHRLSVGISGIFWRPAGGDWLTKIGPKISLVDNFGATELRVALVSGGGTEFQLRRILIF